MKAALIVASIVGTLFVGSANATLESRLGGQAFYDTDLDISWLADANANGNQTWQTQMTWADNLVVVDVDGWRLSSVGEMYYLRMVEGIQAPFPGLGVAGNVGPFHMLPNVYNYWSNHSFDNRLAYTYQFHWDYSPPYPVFGFKSDALAAWAVHDGDVGQLSLISQVPEPETYAMLLAGLGLLGFMARRRKESAI